MAMSYTSLVAPKGTAGSALNWIGYGKVDIGTALDESQALIYSMLRVREMKKEWVFGMVAGQSSVTLPSSYLDPDGPIYDTTNLMKYFQLIDTKLQNKRAYDQLTGTFPNNPFTTTLNSSLVSCHDPAHGLVQDAIIGITGASTFNGITPNGSFELVSVTTDDFVIDLGEDSLANASGTGGGASAIYNADNLSSGTAVNWAVWDSKIKFDVAFLNPANMKLMIYRQPKLLSADNPTNFLTDRYPHLMRTACMAMGAKYMKDDEEYTKLSGELNNLIQIIAAQDDLSLRGASFGTETPYVSSYRY